MSNIEKLFDFEECKSIGLHVRKSYDDEKKYLDVFI